MRTIDATREVVQTAQRAFEVGALPVNTPLFIFLESVDGDTSTVHFVRAKWVSSGLIASNDLKTCNRLRVKRRVARRDGDGDEVATIEPPHQLIAGDVLECCEDDEWRSVAPIIGVHVPRG